MTKSQTTVNTQSPALDEKFERLQSILRDLGSVAVAFSAGIDSTFLLKVAIDTLGPKNVVAVTGRSDSLARAEFQQACELAESLGAEHVVLDTDEFENPEYLANPENRCYFCKTTLYSHMAPFIKQRGIAAMVNGINLDDLGDFRPGIQAAKEHNVESPIADAGLTKTDLRALSKRMGVVIHDKPASPCLSSRLPYGETITAEKLAMVDQGETLLRQEFGIRECRVRHHGTLARIEVPPEYIATLSTPNNAARLDELFRSIGYSYVTLDLRGFRSGSLNEVIAFGKRQGTD